MDRPNPRLELFPSLRAAYDLTSIVEATSRARQGPPSIWTSIISDSTLKNELTELENRAGNRHALPLYGVPFAVKDNIDVKGLVTTAGCPSFAYEPQEDAHVVAKLRAAGAVPIGKTNLDQFATGLVGTRSPFGALRSAISPSHISGGSSSGSAVAVALGHVPFSLGTDTAGSGRVPAAFNELVGVKPTKGLLSTRGLVPACRSLDCVSIFARDIQDAELVLSLSEGFDSDDPFSRSRTTHLTTRNEQRLGTLSPGDLEFFGDEEAVALHRRAVDLLASLMHSIVDVDFEPFRNAARLLYAGAWIAERYASVGEFLETDSDDHDPIVREIILAGKKPSAVDAFRGAYELERLKRLVDKAWTHMDILVLPTTPTTYTPEQIALDPIRTNSRLGTYTNFVNLLDLSALALPAGRRRDGAALGITLMAPAFCEARLLELGARYWEHWRAIGPVGPNN